MVEVGCHRMHPDSMAATLYYFSTCQVSLLYLNCYCARLLMCACNNYISHGTFSLWTVILHLMYLNLVFYRPMNQKWGIPLLIQTYLSLTKKCISCRRRHHPSFVQRTIIRSTVDNSVCKQIPPRQVLNVRAKKQIHSLEPQKFHTWSTAMN